MNICKFGFSLSLISGHSRPAFELTHFLNKKGTNVRILSSQLDGRRYSLHRQLLEREHLSIECYRPFHSIPDFIAHARGKTIKEILSWADIVHVYGLYSLFLLNKFAHIDTKVVFSVGSKFNIGLKDLTNSGLSSFRNLTKLNYLASIMLPNQFFSNTLSMADAMISWTRFMQKEVTSLGAFNPIWIPVGVNVERFQIEANIFDRKFVFLYLGYLASARGVTDLLDAFELVNRQWASTNLIIAHTGMHPLEQNMLLNRIRKSKSRETIEIVGFTTNLSEIMNRANVVVLPFRTAVGYSQPPLTVLEALAHGRPVITTSVGCLHEIIREGTNGFCIPPSDPRLLAESMLRMREVDLDYMSRNAREFILCTHDWRKISESTIQVYNKILSAEN